MFIERRRFSLTLFMICVCEALFWSLPLYTAAHTTPTQNLDLTTYLRQNEVVFEEVDIRLASDAKQFEQLLQQQILSEMVRYGASHGKPQHNSDTAQRSNAIWGVLSLLTAAIGLAGRDYRSQMPKRQSTSAKSSKSSTANSDSAVSTTDPESTSSAESMMSAETVQLVADTIASSAAPSGHTAVRAVEGVEPRGDATQPTQRDLCSVAAECATPCERLREGAQTSRIVNGKANEFSELTDDEIVALVQNGTLTPYSLEDKLEDSTRAVSVRRKLLAKSLSHGFDINAIPYENYDYDNVKDKCCENVIGYLPIPIGVVGPIQINGKSYQIPMATTEGCLVASTHRGLKAISLSGGANAVITHTGMSRGPCVRMPNCRRAAELKAWLESAEGHKIVADAFNSTSRFARLKSIKANLAGRNVYVRFTATTGDAMGMNMISKGVEKSLATVQQFFPDMEIVAISGNFCTDKKPNAANWLLGRGRTVVADAIVKGEVVEKVLKTTVKALVDVNINKNLVGSAMAGSIGGFNAHAANIVTAIFLATGQDPAQNVESSNCITLMEPINDGRDLYISVTMPSLEVGTVGGGTQLPAQAACLEMVQCKGADKNSPGGNADRLAELIAVAVLGGELSLLSAISAGQLVRAHMALNRGKNQNEATPKPAIATAAASACEANPEACRAKL